MFSESTFCLLKLITPRLTDIIVSAMKSRVFNLITTKTLTVQGVGQQQNVLRTTTIKHSKKKNNKH